jgi:GTP cyclohydrolase IA
MNPGLDGHSSQDHAARNIRCITLRGVSPEAMPRPIDVQAAADAIDAFLRALGLCEPDVVGTGARVAEMFSSDLCAGYVVDTRALVMEAVMVAESSVLVAVRDIPVVTTCPHHLVPSIGTATVAFQANERILGLGTVASLVDAHARRLTLQERIGQGVVNDLEAVLAPAWVGCRLVLTHGCMVVRGERAMGTHVETVALRAPPERVAEAHVALGVGSGASKAGGR